jgi:tetratricopeptide (TPR) repeat protein
MALLSVLLTAPPSFAQFDQANQEYAAGQFKDAIRDYQALVDKGVYSAPLFYDLGNAYFRIQDFGRAILNYHRALALDARQPEAEANLRIAQDQARSLELRLTAFENVAHIPGSTGLTITAAVAGCLFLFCFASWLFSRKRTAGRLVFAAALFATISAAAVTGVYALETGRHGSALAIVTAPQVEARVATADNANRVLTLPPGSEVQILSRRGDWVYASLPNQLRGWIPANSVDRVKL